MPRPRHGPSGTACLRRSRRSSWSHCSSSDVSSSARASAGIRELARVTKLPILVGIPRISGLRGRRGITRGMEREGYQSLQTLVAFQLPPTSLRTILITGALHQEGKTESGGRARSRARGPRTGRCSCPPTCGGRPCTKRLACHSRLGSQTFCRFRTAKSSLPWSERLRRFAARRPGQARSAACSRSSPSGEPPMEPAKLLGGPAIKRLFAAAGELGFQYVIIDAPPIIGLADSQILAQRVDGVLVVASIDRLDVDTALDLRETFDRLGVEPLGIIAVGVRAGLLTVLPASSPGRRRSVTRSRVQFQARLAAPTQSGPRQQRCRQCSVSTNALFARVPTHAARSAALPTPYVLLPWMAFRAAQNECREHEGDHRGRTGTPCSARVRT